MSRSDRLPAWEPLYSFRFTLEINMPQPLSTQPFDAAESGPGFKVEPEVDANSAGRDKTIAELQQRVVRLEKSQAGVEHHDESATASRPASVRVRSSRKLFGCPLYDIAFGPDPETGAKKGYAKGIIAIGDYATGGIAIGGLAQGFVAIGGLSWGVFTVGGCTLAMGAGLGGVAVGGYVLGGVAIGVQAFGGVAISVWPALSEFFSAGSISA